MNSALACPAKTMSVVNGTNLASLSDGELVVLCQKDNRGAFEVLVKRHQRTVYGMLMKLAPDWTDTADLAQESFIRIWKGINKLQNPQAFKSWVVQIVTHLFYDELRRRPRRTPILSLDQAMYGEDESDAVTRDIEDPAAGPEELLQRKDLDAMVQSAIASLPRQFRTAIVLRELEDLSYDEIAHLTNTDIGTVKSRISRARSKVQQILRPQFGESKKLSA
ncbi:MAG: sigma-70 family RNA polymerase sigma factor [Candidatus Obscuribacterales bacterium]|nr:sigma-70 family RNA polymerase sigma factor [Candidatus Obscuribacterales bacterium]